MLLMDLKAEGYSPGWTGSSLNPAKRYEGGETLLVFAPAGVIDQEGMLNFLQCLFLCLTRGPVAWQFPAFRDPAAVVIFIKCEFSHLKI